MLPAALFVAATALFAFALLPAIVAPFHTDSSVPFDGQQHEAVLKSTGDKVIWLPYGTLAGSGCLVRDAPTNQSITLYQPTGTLTRTINGRREFAAYRFSPMSTHIVIACGQPGVTTPVLPDVQIGPRVGLNAVGGFVGALVLTLALLVIGALAVLALVILFATRGPRESPASA